MKDAYKYMMQISRPSLAWAFAGAVQFVFVGEVSNPVVVLILAAAGWFCILWAIAREIRRLS